jgi:hypothetical protein
MGPAMSEVPVSAMALHGGFAQKFVEPRDSLVSQNVKNVNANTDKGQKRQRTSNKTWMKGSQS